MPDRSARPRRTPIEPALDRARRRGNSAAVPAGGMREVQMTAYDPNNIFAKILRGEVPCYKVYEDDHSF